MFDHVNDCVTPTVLTPRNRQYFPVQLPKLRPIGETQIQVSYLNSKVAMRIGGVS
jgi:hypothetical protein